MRDSQNLRAHNSGGFIRRLPEGRIQLILVLLLGFVLSCLHSCGEAPREEIIGTWRDAQGFQTVEFYEDNTTAWMDQDTITGQYRFTADDSLSIRWDVSGVSGMRPSVFDLTLRAETLVLRATNGAVLRFQRVIPGE